jgi:cobalt/nickel transport system permease protein
MHISDGVLSPCIWAPGYIITGGLATWILVKKTSTSEVPKLSVITAAVFVSSLIHVPVGPSSVHLVLNGLAGITLGLSAYPAIFIALVLQAFLFQHGGITTIGINTLNTGLPALAAFWVFRAGKKINLKERFFFSGALAGGTAVALSVVFLSLCLILTGEGIEKIIPFIVLAHLPLMMIEALVTGAFCALAGRVKLEILAGNWEARQ